jgi:hypothetical protein
MEDEYEKIGKRYVKSLEESMQKTIEDAWKQKFARLQNLMDVRETQPNKPCCLAARANEREACAKVCEEQMFWLKKFRGEK